MQPDDGSRRYPMRTDEHAISPLRTVIRRLWPAEAHQLRDHLLRLDMDDRIKRFGCATSDEWAVRYCARFDWFRSVVLGFWVDGELRGVGELKPFGSEWPPVAEIAVTVEKAFTNRGVGSELLRRLITVARNRGIARLYMLCLPGNRQIQRIVRKFDAVLNFHDDRVEGEIELPWPDLATFANEILDEGWAFFCTLIGWRHRPTAFPWMKFAAPPDQVHA